MKNIRKGFIMGLIGAMMLMVSYAGVTVSAQTTATNITPSKVVTKKLAVTTKKKVVKKKSSVVGYEKLLCTAHCMVIDPLNPPGGRSVATKIIIK